MDCTRCTHSREDHAKVGCDHKDGFGRICMCWWFESKPRLGAHMRREKIRDEELHPAIARIFPERHVTFKERFERVPTLLKVAAAVLVFFLVI